ncbi:MAG: SMC-Scp complex subunit ScpB [Arachnia sp.]
MSVSRAVEAMLLMATEPLTADDMAAGLGVPTPEVSEACQELAEFYRASQRGFELRRVAGGWRLATAEDLAEVIEAWVTSESSSRLSQAALETLSIVAYLQPTTRGRIAGIRGVNVDGVVKTLAVRGLIAEVGEDPATGATLFVTTARFLAKLGLDSLSELPDLAPLLPDAVALEAELGQLAAGEQ